MAVIPGGAAASSDKPRDSAASSSSIELVVNAEVGLVIADRYRLTALLGEGGMGVVYEAWDLRVERKVAIKLMRSDVRSGSTELKRFRRELEITSRLRHPSTVRVFEHGETPDGRPYMVMEMLTGESLGDRLERGPLDELDALQITKQVAESLSEAHEHGIFHRDLKPDNIFIEKVGVSRVAKVLDFGIAGGVAATCDGTRLTQAGEVFGTPQYMSPEQCNGITLDHRTDIYSLSCILYELVEGRPPFTAETPMATMLKHVRSKAPRMRRAHPATARVIALGLRKDRSNRIQSAGRMSELLGEAIGEVRAALADGRRTSPARTHGSRTRPASGSERSHREARGGLVGGAFEVDGFEEALRAMEGNASGSRGGGAPSARQEGRASSQRRPRLPSGDAFLETLPVVPVRRPGTWFVGLAGAGLVAFAAVAWLKGGNPATPGMLPATLTTDSPLPFNRALVRSNVAGVEVVVDGEPTCQAPCEIKVPVGDGRSHEIRLRKAGFREVVHTWAPQGVDEPLPALPDLQPL